jgi:hypothetical protein
VSASRSRRPVLAFAGALAVAMSAAVAPGRAGGDRVPRLNLPCPVDIAVPPQGLTGILTGLHLLPPFVGAGVGPCVLIPPPHPGFKYNGFQGRQGVIRAARELSDRLEAYIKRWLDGKAPARISKEVLPDGLLYDVTLQRPEEIDPQEQWGTRPAHRLDIRGEGETGLGGDPNASYLVTGLLLPFGARLVIEGEFPRSRFFDIQVT